MNPYISSAPGGRAFLVSARPLLLVLAALVIVACGREAPPRAANPTATRPTSRPAPTSATSEPARRPTAVTGSSVAARAGDDPRSLGDPNAPITVIEYADYQCPFCNTFVQETKRQIEEQYIKTGKVYFVYRDFPLVDIHPGALLASHVANCAADQGGFWAMHDRIYRGAAERAWGQGHAEDFQTFLGYARELKIDGAELQRCVEANTHSSTIQNDFGEGAERGVRSTPTFVINGDLLIGAQPFSVWQRALDDLLAEE